MRVSITSEDNFPGARFGPSYLSATLERALCCPVGEVECQALQGDASNRTYFRTTFQKGAKPEVRGSVIVMQLQEAVPGPETDFTHPEISARTRPSCARPLSLRRRKRPVIS